MGDSILVLYYFGVWFALIVIMESFEIRYIICVSVKSSSFFVHMSGDAHGLYFLLTLSCSIILEDR